MKYYESLIKLKMSNDIIDNVRASKLTAMHEFIDFILFEPDIKVHLIHLSLVKLTQDLIKDFKITIGSGEIAFINKTIVKK